MSTTQTDTFTLNASPGTDVWRKPPSTSRFSGPMKLHPAQPVAKFHRARVSFRGQWTRLYDQGGLLLLLAPDHTALSTPGASQNRWVKAGVEFTHGRPWVSVVGCDRWADWSLFPLPASATGGDGAGSMTLEMRRERSSVWVEILELDERGDVKERTAVRELTWVFADAEESDGWKGWFQVGAYACRPTAEAEEAETNGEGLEVEFWGLEVD